MLNFESRGWFDIKSRGRVYIVDYDDSVVSGDIVKIDNHEYIVKAVETWANHKLTPRTETIGLLVGFPIGVWKQLPEDFKIDYPH